MITLISSLNYEVTTSYTLILSATDHGEVQRTGISSLAVTVTDVNDNTPEFSAARYEFSVSEVATAGVTIGTVTTTDLDRDAANNVVSVVIVTGK